jgi:hypothetical protein
LAIKTDEEKNISADQGVHFISVDTAEARPLKKQGFM